MQRFGLYYPYVHFTSDAWVKAAALYWPRMARMIPKDFTPHDSEVVQELAAGLDFVISLDPKAIVNDVSHMMETVVAEHGDELVSRYGMYSMMSIPTPDSRVSRGMHRLEYRLHSDRRPVVSPRYSLGENKPRLERSLEKDRPGLGPKTELTGVTPLLGSGLVGLHAHETTPGLRRALLECDLAVEDSSPGWIGVSPMLAWVYLCAFAAELASRNTLVAISDELAGHLASDDWNIDRIAAALLEKSTGRSRQPILSMLGHLALRLVIPQDLDGVPVAKIVQIRERYGPDFDSFHDTLTSLTQDLEEELSECTDPNVLQAYLQREIQTHVQQPLRDLEAALRGLGLDTAFAAVSAKFELPAALATATGGLLVEKPIVAGVGAAAFASLGLTRSALKTRRAALEPSAASYLFRIDRKINPRSLLNRIRSRQVG